MTRRDKTALVVICLLVLTLLLGYGLIRDDSSLRERNHLKSSRQIRLDTPQPGPKDQPTSDDGVARYWRPRQNLTKTQPAEVDVPLKESDFAYSSADIHALVKKTLPLVEEITGRRLKRVPEIKLVTRKQYLTETMGEPVQRAPQENSTASRQKDESARHIRLVYTDYALGSYEPRSSTMYLLPGNFRPRLDRAGVPTEYHQPILMMIVAHELTHALQHQEVWSLHTPSKKHGKAPFSWPEPRVIRAITEGHATFVMNRVAEASDFAHAIPQFRKTVSVGLVPHTEYELRDKNAQLRKDECDCYFAGERFIEWHYIRGGRERLWQILKEPPIDWPTIERPWVFAIPEGSTMQGYPSLPAGPFSNAVSTFATTAR